MRACCSAITMGRIGSATRTEAGPGAAASGPPCGRDGTRSITWITEQKTGFHAKDTSFDGLHGEHLPREPPDRRAQAAARARGYELSGQRARRLEADDFREFDYVLVMDDENLRNARTLQPTDGKARLHRFLEFAGSRREREVPDPYYGGSQGFATVMDLVEEAATGFLSHLRERHGL
jgi:protein-tyrosine phosphatase